MWKFAIGVNKTLRETGSQMAMQLYHLFSTRLSRASPTIECRTHPFLPSTPPPPNAIMDSAMYPLSSILVLCDLVSKQRWKVEWGVEEVGWKDSQQTMNRTFKKKQRLT